MEEAELLKERLQAITDKRRVQEDIAKKRRKIEEEKLKLQYIKKKALREQWLMDGLSQQSKEEQEAMRLQAQDELQQSDQLQSNIHSIEKEIETLETQELNISANEEVILKRLKEVERTAEDIIKELNAEFEADVPSLLPDVQQTIQLIPPGKPQKREPGSEEPKKAMFAMEISVERDMRTGKNQVVSTATTTPETVQERGVKVYDDGRKSVYALHSDGRKIHNVEVGEMSPKEVEELLRQATDKKVPSEVQYHQPVYSAPYTGTSRPSTPSKTQRQTPTPSVSSFQTKILSRNGAPNLEEESQISREGWKTPSKMPSTGPVQQHTMPRDGAQRWGEETKQPLSHISGQANTDKHLIPQHQSPRVGAKTPQNLTRPTDITSPSSLVSVTARSEGMPIPIQPVYKRVDSHSPLLADPKPGVGHDPAPLIESSVDCNRQSPFYPQSEVSLNLVTTLPEDLESEPITMIFMGYQNAEEEEEEEEDIQAELVIISNSDDDDDDDDGKNGKNYNRGDEFLSYHPQGYKSKVFRPKVDAKVAGCRDVITNCDDLLPHKPTFIHKPGKRSPSLEGRGMDDSTNTGSINLEKMKLCSTGR